ncbi:MAG: hypothetical protein V3V61_01885 [Gammaproteobacteria bacterium]
MFHNTNLSGVENIIKYYETSDLTPMTYGGNPLACRAALIIQQEEMDLLIERLLACLDEYVRHSHPCN